MEPISDSDFTEAVSPFPQVPLPKVDKMFCAGEMWDDGCMGDKGG